MIEYLRQRSLEFCFAILLGMTLSGVSHAQTNSSIFPETMKDFGVVPRGPMLKHYFTVKNTTGQNLQLGSVRVSCGCVTANLTSQNLAPGQSAALYATMDTRRFLGDKLVTIYVQVLSPSFEELSLQVKAYSRSDVQISPDTLNFGRVQRGKPNGGKVTVSFYGNPGWQITQATCPSNYVTPKVTQVKATAAEVAYEIEAELRADIPVGRWFTDITLQTNQESVPRLRVPVSVEVTSVVVAQPTELRWPTAKVGEPAETRVILRAAEPFKIVRVEGAQGPLAVEGVDDEAKAIHVLTFRYTATEAGQFQGTLKVVTDVKDEPEVVLPASVLATE